MAFCDKFPITFYPEYLDYLSMLTKKVVADVEIFLFIAASHAIKHFCVIR
jgi:hypothetical protein